MDIRQRGQGRFKLFLALLLTAAIILGAVRIVPVYIRSYEFNEAVREAARFAGVRSQAPGEIRQQLFQKAQQLELPIRPEQIQVVPIQRGIRISVHYSVPVKLIVYTLTLNFESDIDTGSAY